MHYQCDFTLLRAALIRTALQEQQPALATESRAWLDRQGLAQLLDHPGAVQFTPEARQRKYKQRASASQPMEA